jgi:molecular chaperone GrpE (heat shock protein)
MKFAETKYLASTVEQITNLRTFTNQISFATAQWQIVQEQASKTVEAAKQIGDRMAVEAQAFSDFMVKASDAEKAHLRLEVDKLRRSETEWLQVLVLLMDHTYALYLAGRRSGQENIIQQLGTYQNACRDVARKVGLVAFEAQADEGFNPKIHQVLEGDTQPSPTARVVDTLAPGFTFQGQRIRNVLVSIKEDEAVKPVRGSSFPIERG